MYIQTEKGMFGKTSISFLHCYPSKSVPQTELLNLQDLEDKHVKPVTLSHVCSFRICTAEDKHVKSLTLSHVCSSHNYMAEGKHVKPVTCSHVCFSHV